MTPGAPGERRPLIWCKAVILVTTHLAKAKVTGAHGDRRAGTWDLRVGDPAVGPGQGPRRSSSGCAALLQTPRRAGRSPPTGRRCQGLAVSARPVRRGERGSHWLSLGARRGGAGRGGLAGPSASQGAGSGKGQTRISRIRAALGKAHPAGCSCVFSGYLININFLYDVVN